MRALLLLAMLPMVSVAEEYVGPGNMEEALRFLPVILEALRSGNYLVAGAAVALILTFLARKYLLPKMGLGNGFLPVISALVGLIAGVGLAIVGGASADAAMLAVMSGPLASVLWDALFKYFFKK